MRWGPDEIERFREELRRGVEWLGNDAVQDVEMSGMVEYASRLAAAAQEQNLTAIEEPAEVAWKHFVDSLVGWKVYREWAQRRGERVRGEGGSLADLGAGAGFPGVVWTLVEPWRAVEIEAEGRKAEFLRRLGDLVGRERLTVFQGRAEEAARRVGWRGQFDVVVARAVARLDVVAEYGLPLLRLGGALVAYKGPRAAEELAWLTPAAREGLGVGAIEKCGVTLPEGWGERCVIILEKGRNTLEMYPRRVGVPEKRPLGGGRRKGRGGERV